MGYKSVSDKLGLYDSERDMADILPLESLDNKQNALHQQENWYSGLDIVIIR